MKNDITRDTFDRLNHFSRVLMQQGRVQLDADWNEQVGILLNYLQTMMVDLVGPSAGPVGACGFGLLVTQADIKALKLPKEDEAALIERLKKEEILVSQGRYYADGLLAENDEYASFFQQPSSSLNPDALKKMQAEAKGPVILYLDVWERHLTAIDDDRIREIALGGPDTTTRAKITWVLRARVPVGNESKKIPATLPPPAKDLGKLRDALQPEFEAWRNAQRQNRGLMRAGIEEQPKSEDPCVNSPESVYRGNENQLYRVEIHKSGSGWDGKGKAALADTATFKWSRDNGSVAAAWLDGDGNVLSVTPSRDQARGFAGGQWIELSDDRNELESIPGTLVQITDVESGSLTIDPATAHGSIARTDFPQTPKVRRWDQEETEEITLSEGAIQIQYDKWFALEDGMQVQFPTPTAPNGLEFRSGDYWLIPARVATRDIEWPWEHENDAVVEGTARKRRALPPHGVTHHYALLGLLAAGAANPFNFADLRRKFAPLISA
jgi:hypothetical protein